jgi:hypothetical protein
MGLEKREREPAATRTASVTRRRSQICAAPASSPPRPVRSEKHAAVRLQANLPRHHGRPRKQGGYLLLQLLTPRRHIEEPCRRRAPVPDPPRIWRETAGDGPSAAAPEHQKGTQPLPPPDRVEDDDSAQSSSPPRPARSGRGGAIISSREMTKALFGDQPRWRPHGLRPLEQRGVPPTHSPP